MSERTPSCSAANTEPAAAMPMTLPRTSASCSEEDVRPCSTTGDRDSESTDVEDMASPMPVPHSAAATPTRP